MTSNASVMDRPGSLMISTGASTSNGSGPVSMTAHYIDGALQAREKTWYPVEIGIPAEAAVAAVMATWRHR